MTTLTSRYGSAVVTTPSDREIHITRIFDAPAAVIFDAWTTPEHVRQWWGTPEARWSSATSTIRSAATGATSSAIPTVPRSAGTAPV